MVIEEGWTWMDGSGGGWRRAILLSLLPAIKLNSTPRFGGFKLNSTPRFGGFKLNSTPHFGGFKLILATDTEADFFRP
jgi:hypothetical protein